YFSFATPSINKKVQNPSTDFAPKQIKDIITRNIGECFTTIINHILTFLSYILKICKYLSLYFELSFHLSYTKLQRNNSPLGRQ
ncbi:MULTISPECIES: hypothetical protein, partial [unclassified Bacillus (in: firmicutes)]|uniref:hypothetical protein n=1 Tax=unclassified Bacillus (in: firmicutes) TaxID=185979 RepID=UPI001E379E0C